MMFSVSQRTRRCGKCKWVVLILTLAAVYTALHRKEDSIFISSPGTKCQVARQAKATKITSVEETPRSGTKHYDVILNSYMRGGSTLLGSVLGFRDDTFYVYEPLWKLSRWTYWHGNSTVCRLDRPECRLIKPDMDIDRQFANNLNKNSQAGSLALAKKILQKLYDCLFNDTERTMVEGNLTARLGGPSWDQIRACLKRYKNLKFCLHKYAPDKCKRSRHKVSKVLRLTADNLEPLLRERENLKVVHLFRDPRAIINSRIATKWYPAKTKTEIINNARSLCNKMMYDFNAGIKLKAKYEDRFRYIYYEDFCLNPLEKAKALYSYLGMSLNEDRYKRVTQISIFNNQTSQTDRQRNTAFWWRVTLDWDMVKEIDAVCDDVIKALGYVSFETKADLRNLSLPSVKIPKNYPLVLESDTVESQ